MKENLETIFCLFLGKRKTNKQKRKFLLKLIEVLKNTKYKYEFSKAKTVLSSSVNLYYGNIKKASIVLCTYYDTPTKKYFFKDYYPFDGMKTHKVETREKALSLLLLYGIVVLCLSLILFDAIKISIYPLPFKLLSVILSIFILSKASTGFENSLNFNRSNSSVITLIEWMNENHNNGVAVAFIDNGTTDKLGAQLLSKDMEENNPIVLMIDCIGQGSRLNLANTANIDDFVDIVDVKRHMLVSKYSNHYFFKKIAVISAGNDQGNSVVVQSTGTKKDIILQRSLIDETKSVISTLVTKI